MNIFRRALLAGLFGLCVPWVQAAAQTQARLVLAAAEARPGDTVWAGVELRMPLRWHTYWRNPGDSGSPTKIQWQLPNGISAGEVQWPAPEKFVSADLFTYGYHDRVVLLVPLTLAKNVASGAAEIKANVSWLECEELCVQGTAALQTKLQVGSAFKKSSEADLIETWQKRIPLSHPPFAVNARWENSAEKDARALVIEWTSTATPAEADFFPYRTEQFDVGGATERVNTNKVALRKTVNKLEGNWPNEIAGVLVLKSTAGVSPEAFEVKLALADAGANKAADTPARAGSINNGNQPKKSLWAMLGLAFLGGLILNVMPCVLPVIALKILGFVKQGREEPARVRRLSIVYALGVFASFLVLALLVIMVQHAGRAANWSMQFQNPQFLIAMTVLVTLVALNLFGVFEINLSGQAMGVAGTLVAKEGYPGAFFNGVLATILGTSCTAPYLTVALGFAFSQSASIIVLMLLTIGFGFAAPYLVLSFEPKLLKVLPKPGPWMESFKKAMGFPMLATAIWLFWLTTDRFGSESTLSLGFFLVVLAMAAWIWGEFVQRGTRGRSLAIAVSLILVALGYYYGLERELNWRSPPAASRTAGENTEGIQWKPWSAKAVEEARSTGHPVLVDFTAKWCPNCRFNKRTSINIPSVQAKLKELNVVTLIGDYTDYDPAITEELKRFERAGVPLVLVYSADPDAPPIVLPPLLTPGIVLNALDKVATKSAISSAGAAETTSPFAHK